jgi:3-dehydroquinate dehydratase/shikimate dehydrogenase
MTESSTAIVETVTGESMAEICAARDRAIGQLVELRLDGVGDLNVEQAIANRRVPVIVTIRAAWEGGRFEGSEQERLALLQRAIDAGAEYVDVEWRADRRAIRSSSRTQLVLSHHDFSGVPSDLEDRIAAMAATQPDILKVAVQPARLADCVRLQRAMALDRPHVAIAMGSIGQISRLCPWLFGSCWTYGGAAAPGQVGVDDLCHLYRVHERSARTAIYGIAGQPLGHSASPAMHNPAFRALGMDAVYVTFETADADELLDAFEAFGVSGASVTAPLKPSVFARVGDVDALTRDIGALNTLKREERGWAGRNFDVAGFLAPLERRRYVLSGRRTVILGAGGSARTAAWALRSAGASVAVSARRSERAAELAQEFGLETLAWPPAPGWDLLVNTTPVGTWPATTASPLDRAFVRGGAVYDLIYNPAETTLLQWAREAGADTIGGLEMLVGQACHQFEWWTGAPAPIDTMTAAARAHVARAQRHP